tara:strand:+ start:6664 stop:12570 length:5907 start_codon:yes stop_codon:yes gene_type:complete
VVRLEYSERINFAFQQNSIPVLRRIDIVNTSEEDWHDVECLIKTVPEWAETYRLVISHIPAGASYALNDVPLKLDLEYFAKLSERVRSEIQIEVLGSEQPPCEGDAERELQSLSRESFPVEVYAYDEWTGMRSLPEILAAFVTPNLAVVEQILSNAAQILGKRTSSSALDGYQAKSKKRVYEILDAIYDALREQGINYSNPAASFETTGQRIRFGTQILKSRLGTCLDLALLFASIIEQSGLHPLILMHRGHAYVGCWLVGESFSDPAMDDLQSIRKRRDLEDLIVFESTLICEGKAADFNQAVMAAQPHLMLDDVFEAAIDIYRCRSSRIRPLPLERNDGGVDVQKAQEVRKVEIATGRSRANEVEFREELSVDNLPQTPEGRVDNWKQQLLDLTLRNRLLNFKESKQTIPLLCPKPEQIEDELAAEQTFQVLEQTQIITGTDPRSLSLLSQQTQEDPLVEHLMRELQAKRLRSSLTEKELNRRLLELYRKVRLENEESGANTLFLALGFLEWKQDKDDERSYRAPLLLVPVQLHRKSVQSGFSLQRYDEDTLVNVTLLELLKRDYHLEVPGVNPLPEDESGVDVDRVFRLFQQAVRDLAGWEVRREVWLAQFSFSKFLLWKDLQDRAEVLGKNPVVGHLMNRPGESFLDEIDDWAPHELDEALGYDEIFCPMSFDSSQLAATLAAAKGKNFVMNGPPGTGKSQTITNIIAHCVAEGKRVLFVAEKRAALEVVHHRLSQIGLGPFCLELHSNKSGKAEVLRQFGEAINYVEGQTTDEWSILADRLNKLRKELNDYVGALHRVYPNRFSAYQCLSWLVAHEAESEVLSTVEHLEIDKLEEHSREDFESLQGICDQLILRGSERRLPVEAKHAFGAVKASDWTPEWEDEVFDLTNETLAKVGELQKVWTDVASKFGLDPDHASQTVLLGAANLTSSLRGAPALPAKFVTESNWRNSFQVEATEWIRAGRSRDEALSRLEAFDIEVLRQMDTETLEGAYQGVVAKGGLFQSLKLWFLLKPVRKAVKPGSPKWKSAEAGGFFEAVRRWKTEQGVLDAAKSEASVHFGSEWEDGHADWDYLEGLLEYGEGLQTSIQYMAGDSVDLLIQLRSKVGDLVSAGSEFLQEGGSFEKLFAEYGVAWKAFNVCSTKLQEKLSLHVPETVSQLLDHWQRLANGFNEQRGYLANWCRWQSSFQQGQRVGLSRLLEALETGELQLENLRTCFDFAYRNSFLKRLLTINPLLRDFYGDEHQKRIEAFRDFDEKYTELTGQIVAARLASRLPRARSEACPRNTELGLIQREMVKRRRHKPVRKLLAEIPGIAPFLKPCFLMSPLSVAQYLDAEQAEFDLVVFDEASQIPVWDAIGAIARGKQVIVVGDPKQLPPTNFFNRGDSDDGFYDDSQTEDLESILDECLGSGLKTYSLNWHYRSRKEGLIAFSNYHYYANELHTFPSPHSENVGVSLVPVPKGFYDKGKSRTNQAEAEAIVGEVVRRLTDPELSGMSIGIVTFSQAQQGLILDLLDAARSEMPEIEAFFGDDLDEPVFVKNLENVQGDERDLILFSICYGPDQAGKLSMNFGPLNRQGGERRLNVAVTRAKHEVVIYSTLRSEQIDLSRTRAIGAAHLKAYLEYAERGPAAIAANIESAQSHEYDSIFEQEVAEFLRSQGYTVHTQIGCSSYRIDLAVVRPEAPGQYLLGIECDGATYHRAATARDRDRLRQAVLEGLGWRIYRIWSTDWWRNGEIAQEDLLAEVKAAIEAPVETRSEPAPASPRCEEEPEVQYAYDVQPQKTTSIDERRLEYPEIKKVPQGPQELFYEPQAGAGIRSQIERIIKTEGPITGDLLMRRVAQEWGFNRVASKISEIVEKNLPNTGRKDSSAGDVTFWPDSLDSESYRFYRVADRDVRKFGDIPRKELCNAALAVLEGFITYPKNDFPAQIASQFGFGRGGKIIQVAELAIAELLRRGEIVADGDDFKQP